MAASENRDNGVGSNFRMAVRKKRRSNMGMRIVIAWTVILLGIVILRQHSRESKYQAEQLEAVSKRAKETIEEERKTILSGALSDCHRALGGFLTAGTPELRNQFVVNPIETAGKMATFYRYNPFPKVEVTKLKRTDQELIRVGNQWMVSTRWKEEGDDGAVFDAIFQMQSGTWKLDWAHFSKYGDFPWSLFLAGHGPDEAEFRLLVRQRLQEDDAERSGARLSFVMASPEWGKPAATGMESSEFVVDRRGDDGILLEAALQKKTDGESLFGSSFAPLEPEGFVRVRVRVRREDIGGVRRFEIEELPACHWIDADDRGFDLEALKDDLFGVF